MPSTIITIISLFSNGAFLVKYVYPADFIYSMGSLVLILAQYNSSVFTLLYNMRKFHRLEYREHKWRIARLFVFTESSIFLVLIFLMLGFQTSWCFPKSDPPSAEYIGMNDGHTGICAYYVRETVMHV